MVGVVVGLALCIAALIIVALVFYYGLGASGQGGRTGGLLDAYGTDTTTEYRTIGLVVLFTCVDKKLISIDN